jgi:hypothetical protein
MFLSDFRIFFSKMMSIYIQYSIRGVPREYSAYKRGQENLSFASFTYILADFLFKILLEWLFATVLASYRGGLGSLPGQDKSVSGPLD